MRSESSLVHIVDDDDAVRDSLGLLVRSVGLQTRLYASAEEFLASFDRRLPGCLVSDVRMPGLSGLELQVRLKLLGAEIPIIFITGHGDVPMAVAALKDGAIDFVQKPFRDQDLLDRIQQALRADGDRRRVRELAERARAHAAKLTPREREVMEHVIRGHANKTIAATLGVSQRTVELHRARVMHKMGVRSLAELVRMAEGID
jgi:two-component system response regulator FixJ